MKAGKGTRTAVANRKPANSKLLLASTKLVQEKLLPGSSKARNFEDSYNQNDNDIKLLPVKAGEKPRTIVTNVKPVSDKLLLTSTKLTLENWQDMRAKKVLTLKTG